MASLRCQAVRLDIIHRFRGIGIGTVTSKNAEWQSRYLHRLLVSPKPINYKDIFLIPIPQAVLRKGTNQVHVRLSRKGRR